MMPDPVFFDYCNILLEKFRLNNQIYIISGGNVLRTFSKENSYYFSRATSMWGWATWKRVWAKYDFYVKFDNASLAASLNEIKMGKPYIKMITGFYSKLSKTENRSFWDYQVDYMLFLNKAINIMPNSHLVGNIGFSPEGTHTKEYDKMCEKDINYNIMIPLRHPDNLVVDEDCDKITFKKSYYISLPRILRGTIKKQLKRILKLN